MRRNLTNCFLFVTIFALLGFASAAHATTITAGTYTLEDATFTINSINYTLTGTVALNSSGDVLTTGTSVMFNDSTYSDPSFTGFSNNIYSGLNQATSSTTTAPGGGMLTLYIDLTGTGGLPLCYSYSVDCTTDYGYGETNIEFYSPGLGPVAVNSGAYLELGGSSQSQDPPATPEPSSLVLLGTGALGLAGMVRRRYLKA